MNNYFGNFISFLGESDFVELTLYAVGFFLSIIMIIIVALVVKGVVNRKVRKVKHYRMDLNALTKMRRTGLVSEEEYKRIKSKLIQRFMESTPTEEQKPPEKGQELPLKLPPINIAKPEVQIGATRPSPRPRETRPVDINDLLKKGLISPEEYRQLSSFAGKNPASK